MEVLTNGQQQTMNCYCSLFGCHVDIDNVAPGMLDRGYRGWGWGLTLDGDIVHHCNQAMVDCCCHWADIVTMVEERRCRLLLMSKLSISVADVLSRKPVKLLCIV